MGIQNLTQCELDDWFAKLFNSEMKITQCNGENFCNKRIGIALVGVGRMGQVHLRNILREPRAKLIYACDVNQTCLDSLARSFIIKETGVKVLHVDHFDVALKDPNVHAMLIASSTSTHYELTRRALEAGKNVLCEKPLAPGDIEGIRELHKLASANKVVLLTAFNRRYDPDFRDIYTKVKEGAMGHLHMVRLTARDSQRPPLSYIRNSGGLFHDCMVHDLDIALWLTRQLPCSVQVMGKKWQEYYMSNPEQLKTLSEEDRQLLAEVDDYIVVVVTLKFPDNTLCVIDASRLSNYGFDQRCEVYGSKGLIKLDGKQPLSTVTFSGDGLRQSGLTHAFVSRYNAAYENELRDFIKLNEIQQAEAKSLDQTKARKLLLEPIRGAQVYASALIADKCQLAADEKRTVDIDWPEDVRRQFELENA